MKRQFSSFVKRTTNICSREDAQAFWWCRCIRLRAVHGLISDDACVTCQTFPTQPAKMPLIYFGASHKEHLEFLTTVDIDSKAN